MIAQVHKATASVAESDDLDPALAERAALLVDHVLPKLTNKVSPIYFREERMMLEFIAEVLGDAMRSIPWLVRVESLGSAAVAREFAASANEGSLVLAALDRESSEVVDMVEYGDLERLDAAPERVVAWAGCVAAVLARAGATERISELIPAPALLAEPSLVKLADFERARFDVELEERCVARLRR